MLLTKVRSMFPTVFILLTKVRSIFSVVFMPLILVSGIKTTENMLLDVAKTFPTNLSRLNSTVNPANPVNLVKKTFKTSAKK
jgi:hypothetical protein